MVGADMYVGWVTGTTTTTILDTKATAQAQPGLDTSSGGQDNILSPSGSQVNFFFVFFLGWEFFFSKSSTATTLKFTRKLNTGDPNDIVISDVDLNILYAIGSSDGDANNNYAKHISVGVGKVNFLSGKKYIVLNFFSIS